MNNYVLITPARNEADYIAQTIESLLKQTILPLKWVIVSDGSTDRTDEIVESLINKYDFIDFLKTKDRPDRNFGSKVAAFNLGLEQLDGIGYDFIGNLDADITFENDYYEQVLKKFALNNKLGIAGGVRFDVVNGKLEKIMSSKNSVAGGFQLFRTQCFKDIGGYQKLQYGGIDAVAEISARMHGWEVESFGNIIAHHLKPTGTAVNNVIKQKFRAGVKFYLLGYHPILTLIRYTARLFHKPIIIGSLLSIFGYFWAWFRRYQRPVSDDFVKYLRSEQKGRIKLWLSGRRDNLLRT
jgi:glycosyltransferase involved in cell wall biosynthesis